MPVRSELSNLKPVLFQLWLDWGEAGSGASAETRSTKYLSRFQLHCSSFIMGDGRLMFSPDWSPRIHFIHTGVGQ